MLTVPTNEGKRAVHEANKAKDPLRVTLNWGVNPRIILLDPALNPEGITYEQMLHDAAVVPVILSRFQEYVPMTLGQTSDKIAELPERWSFFVENQNIYDAAYFGAEVLFKPGQVPCSEPFMTIDDVDDFLARDFSQPLENPWIRNRLAFWKEIEKAAKEFSYLGRRGDIVPFNCFFDGPVTVATNLFGEDIFLLLGEDPEKAGRLFEHITRACIVRNRALADLAGGWKKSFWGDLADDSIQLIGTAMYEEYVLPVHELWYSEMSDTTPASRKRNIHLCGDATRHFPLIAEKLGVVGFDTGFPVDHGALRKALGPDIHISGGPHVGLLRDGTPGACYEETRRILQSGVMEGKRFGLREGNNLPPCVPQENLAAVYEACLEYGWYRQPEPK